MSTPKDPEDEIPETPFEAPEPPPMEEIITEKKETKESVLNKNLKLFNEKYNKALQLRNNLDRDFRIFPLEVADQKRPIYTNKEGFCNADKKSISLTSIPHAIIWAQGSDIRRTIRDKQLKEILDTQKAFGGAFDEIISPLDRLIADMDKFKNLTPSEKNDLGTTVINKMLEAWTKELDARIQTIQSESSKIKEKRESLLKAMREGRKDALSRSPVEGKTFDEDSKAIAPWQAALGMAFIEYFEQQVNQGIIKSRPDVTKPGNSTTNQLIDFMVNVVVNRKQFKPKVVNSVFDTLEIFGINVTDHNNKTLSPSVIGKELESVISRDTKRKYEGIPASLINKIEEINEGLFKRNDTSRTIEKQKLAEIAKIKIQEGRVFVGEKGKLSDIKAQHQAPKERKNGQEVRKEVKETKTKERKEIKNKPPLKFSTSSDEEASKVIDVEVKKDENKDDRNRPG